MSACIEHLTNKQVLERFAALVGICRELKARGKLYSGFVYSIKDGKIHAEPVPPAVVEGMDFPVIAGKYLAAYQQIRNWLSRHFEMSSDEWNKSQIGLMLNYLEREFRQQTNKIQDAAKQEGSGMYDSVSIGYLAESIFRLTLLIADPSFRKKSKWRQLRRLNAAADDFFRVNRNRLFIQQLGASGEMALALEELRLLRGESKELINILRPLVNMLDSFERYRGSV